MNRFKYPIFKIRTFSLCQKRLEWPMKKKKILLVYKSKSGFTKKYGTWITKDLTCSIKDFKDFDKNHINEYDYIIYGSRIHAGKLDGFRKIISYFEGDQQSKLILFATGASPSQATDLVESIWSNSFFEAEHHKIPHFYMQSGLDYDKMGKADRLIMKTLANILSLKSNKNSQDKGCQEAIKTSYDYSNKNEIASLVEYVKGLDA